MKNNKLTKSIWGLGFVFAATKWVTLGSVILLGTGLAQACQICVPFPKKSAADHLLDSDIVVLAREDADRPFHFRSVAVLKGELDDKAIDLFLDSATRRGLKAYPQQSVVLVGNAIENRIKWMRVGLTDAKTEPIIRNILKLAPGWVLTPGNRIDFFTAYLGHENDRIRTLAHLETGRAPYSVIRTLGDALDREDIRAFLSDFRSIEWHDLYILLLAQSDNASDHAYIEQSLRDAARFSTTYRLAAWATASIERSGEKTIDFLRREYFENANRKPEELKAVIQAFSVHGTNGHTDLRDRIVAAYKTLLEVHPAMTLYVVQDAIAWKRTEFTEAIESYSYDNPGVFCGKIAGALPCSCPDDKKTDQANFK